MGHSGLELMGPVYPVRAPEASRAQAGVTSTGSWVSPRIWREGAHCGGSAFRDRVRRRGSRASRATRASSRVRAAPRQKWRPCPALRYSSSLRSLSALPMTDTEERLMAAAASMGLSSSPKSG